ncbi:MAG: serine hydrolase domain-containing protein [Acidobacteriota bacterium]
MRQRWHLALSTLVLGCPLAAAGDSFPGEVPTLWIEKSEAAAGALSISWLPSCSGGARDYALFEGHLGDWYGHVPLSCSMGTDLIEDVTPGAGSRYYLVVPTDLESDGLHGTDGFGRARPRGGATCRPELDDTACGPDTPSCTTPADPGEDEKIGILRDYVAVVRAPPMASLAVVHEGSLVATSGLGGADGETMFWTASTSKLVTAVGAVSLMGEGLLDPDASVLVYVPEYSERNRREAQVLVRHLLQNRSGLPQDGGCANFACRRSFSGDATTVQYDLMVPDRGATLGNVFTPTMLARPPYSIFNETSFVPGTDYQYAGWGWMLVGRAMELAAGETFDVLLQERVLDRAGLCRATYDGSTVDANVALGTGTNAIDGYCLEPMLAPGHQGEGAPYHHDELDCAARMPQGGLHASAHDMGRLAEAILQDLDGAGVITDPAAMRLLFCPGGGSGVPGAPGSTCFGRAAVTGDQAIRFGADYGFGNFRRTYDYRGTTHDIYNHGGGRAGFGSYFAIIPEAGLGVVVLTNDGRGADWHDVAECAIRIYLHDATSCF